MLALKHSLECHKTPIKRISETAEQRVYRDLES